MAATPTNQTMDGNAKYHDLASIFSYFGIQESDLAFYGNHTDSMTTAEMDSFPPRAAMDPFYFHEFSLQRAVAAASEMLNVPRTLIRYVMHHLPEAAEDDPYKDDHPITRTVLFIYKMVVKP
jgi:hypothetical protein